VLTRVHSECLTGDVFGSSRCDCGPQLDEAMERIVAEGRGVVVYLRRAPAARDVVRDLLAPHADGSGTDELLAAQVLRELGVRSTRRA